MTLRSFAGFLLVFSPLMVACGDSSDSGGSTGAGGDDATSTATTTTTSSAATGSGGGTSGSGGAGQGGEGQGGQPAAPEAPVMKSVAKMSGALHVTWSNTTNDCDAVVLWRKQDEAEYAIAYTLSGAATSQHDTEATSSSSTYCYKAQCERGELVSADSNEKCGTP